MDTHILDEPSRRDARRLMNTALWRMTCVAAASIVFALVHCVAPVDDGAPLVVGARSAPNGAAQPGDEAAAADSNDAFKAFAATGRRVHDTIVTP